MVSGFEARPEGPAVCVLCVCKSLFYFPAVAAAVDWCQVVNFVSIGLEVFVLAVAYYSDVGISVVAASYYGHQVIALVFVADQCAVLYF